MSITALLSAALLVGAPAEPCTLTVPVATPEAPAVALALPELPAVPQAPATDAVKEVAPAEPEEIVVSGRRHVPGDPLRGVNTASFAAAQGIDRALVRPMAMAYQHVVPSPARSGLRNFFRNLHEPVVFLNFLLQLKPRSAVRTLGRFAINSTIGAAGLIDMARRRPFHLPFRPNGFANTLAYYGVGPGVYVFLPFFGPTTLRDLVGRGVDMATLPMAVGPGSALTSQTYVASSTAVRTLDRRAEFDMRLNELRDGSPDAYASIRDNYLRGREAEIAELKARAPRDRQVRMADTDPLHVAPHPE